MIIISGSSNQSLAQEISQILGARLADIEISKFPNGEKRIWIKEDLAGEDVAIIQSFSDPVDEHIVELNLIADASKHLKARQTLAVIPWMGYSPQDKEFRKGEPISVHVIARMIQSVDVNQVLTVDIHSQSSLDLFDIPAHQISALSLFVSHFKQQDLADHVVVSVDKGSLELATNFSQQLELPLVVFDKLRDRATGQVSLTHVSGEVEGKKAIAIDDFVSTGSTRISASAQLKSMGLVEYHDCITHALLAGNSPQKLQDSQIDSIITTNTYPVPKHKLFPKLSVLSIAKPLAEKISQLTE